MNYNKFSEPAKSAKIEAAAEKGDIIEVLKLMNDEQEYFDIIKSLVDKATDIDKKNDKGESILLVAAHKGYDKIVELLLNKGANINQEAKYSEAYTATTALIYAANTGHKQLINLLLDKGADINYQDQDGDTALTRAALWDHKEIVELLLDRGADINYQDQDGGTALMGAAFWGRKEVVELLLDRGADVSKMGSLLSSTALILAIRQDHKEIAKLLLDRGSDINQVDINNRTALMTAASKGNVEIAALLLNKGADMNHANNSGGTALMVASRAGKENMVEFLLDKGADFTKTSRVGKDRTALEQSLNSSVYHGKYKYHIAKQFILAGAFEQKDMESLIENLDKILNTCHAVEKPTVMANLIVLWDRKDKKFANNSHKFLDVIKEAEDFINAETFAKWEQRSLCQKLQKLKAKTKITDLTEEILNDFWNGVEKSLFKLERVCKNGLDTLDMPNDISKELEAYLDHKDKEKIISSMPTRKVFDALRKGDIQELRSQTLKVEKKLSTKGLAHENSKPETGITLENLLNKGNMLIKQDVLEDKEEGSAFVHLAKEYIGYEKMQAPALPYETLGIICEALRANTKQGLYKYEPSMFGDTVPQLDVVVETKTEVLGTTKPPLGTCIVS